MRIAKRRMLFCAICTRWLSNRNVFRQLEEAVSTDRLATLQGQYTFDYGKLMASALVLTVPVLIIYAIFQRYIIRSISMTGIKG